jgi:hypothetical protein
MIRRSSCQGDIQSSSVARCSIDRGRQTGRRDRRATGQPVQGEQRDQRTVAEIAEARLDEEGAESRTTTTSTTVARASMPSSLLVPSTVRTSRGGPLHVQQVDAVVVAPAGEDPQISRVTPTGRVGVAGDGRCDDDSFGDGHRVVVADDLSGVDSGGFGVGDGGLLERPRLPRRRDRAADVRGEPRPCVRVTRRTS